MKNLKNLGKALNRVEQKLINGGQVFGGPCFEWCACPDIQEMYWKPLNCSCNTGGSGGSGGGGNSGGDGPVDPV